MTVADNLKRLGIVLGTPTSPRANYVPFVISGNLLYLSGQISQNESGILMGRIGQDSSVEQGVEAARACAINLITQMQVALGDLQRVTRIIKLNGFISCTPDFYETPLVMNGASDLFVAVFGEIGRHGRTTIGGTLPRNALVEIDAIVEFKP